MEVRDKFRKINIPDLEERYMNVDIETTSWMNILSEYRKKNPDPRRPAHGNWPDWDFFMKACDIDRPYRTLRRVLGQPNFTSTELEDNPRVWYINYDNKFDFMAFVSQEYKGTSYEIVLKEGENRQNFPLDIFVNWVEDLYKLMDTEGTRITRTITLQDPYGEEWWEDDVVDENHKLKTFEQYKPMRKYILRKKSKVTKLSNKDVDPYSEEDWGTHVDDMYINMGIEEVVDLLNKLSATLVEDSKYPRLMLIETDNKNIVDDFDTKPEFKKLRKYWNILPEYPVSYSRADREKFIDLYCRF